MRPAPAPERVARRLSALSDACSSAVFHTDAAGRLLEVNARWREVFGLAADAPHGDDWARHVHPDDAADVREAWQRSQRRGVPFEREFRVRRPDGETRTVHARAVPVAADGGSDADGDGDADAPCDGFVGVCDDVSPRRAAEQRLRASDAFLDRTGRLASVGGWELDLRTNALSWSQQTRRIYEVEYDHPLELDEMIKFFPLDARRTMRAAVRAAVRDGRPWDLELPFMTALGHAKWVRSLGEVEFEEGQPARLIGAMQDITEHRRRSAELQHERAQRLQIERHVAEMNLLMAERDRMIDVLAHEVRQPLNNASAALQSAAGVLADCGENVARPRLARAEAVLGDVLAAIDNTLAVASLLARPGTVDLDDADVDAVVAVAMADIVSPQRERIAFVRESATRTAAMDTGLMRLALRNLLSNAVKYSPPGSPVTVTLADSDEPLALTFDVSDRGPGIAKSLLPHLFGRGERSAAAAVHGSGPRSMGLGLYIVQRVMRLQGGDAVLVSSSAAGTTMRLVLVQGDAMVATDLGANPAAPPGAWTEGHSRGGSTP